MSDTEFKWWGLVLAALGLVFTVLLGWAAVWVGKKALAPPKRRLSIGYGEARPLISQDGANLGISVHLKDRVLERPHFTEVRVGSTGRHAVSSELFDKSRPITLAVGTPIISLQTTSDVDFVELCGDHDTQVHIGPELFNPGTVYDFWLLTEGEPEFKLDGVFVIDTDVELGSLTERGNWQEVVKGIQEVLPPILAFALPLGFVNAVIKPGPKKKSD